MYSKPKSVKQFLIFSLLFVFINTANASAFSNEKSREKTQGQNLEPSERTAPNRDNNLKKSEAFNEDDDSSDEKEVESDSSYYSVNKFNILFYYVYKLKYGDDESTPSEE